MFKRTTLDQYNKSLDDRTTKLVLSDRDTESMKVKKLHLSSIAYKVRSSFKDGVDSDGNDVFSTCMHTTYHAIFHDKDTIFGRLWTSKVYAARSYFAN